MTIVALCVAVLLYVIAAALQLPANSFAIAFAFFGIIAAVIVEWFLTHRAGR